MRLIFPLFVCLLMLGIALYMFFFFRRLWRMLFPRLEGKWLFCLSIACGVLYGVCSLLAPPLISVLLLHVFVIQTVFQLVHFTVRRIAKKRYEGGMRAFKAVYCSGILPLLLAAVMVTAGYLNMYDVTRSSYTLYTDKAIPSEGYRFVVISDVHFGVSIDESELARVADEIEAQSVDAVFLCGDLVDDRTEKEEMHVLFETLGAIDTELGVYYVYGNHDRNMKALSSHFTDEELVAAIEGSGITILCDEAVHLTDTLTVIGREDRSREREAIGALTADCDQSDYIVTLDHQPSEYGENGKAGTDLLLSGHTHAGQFFPMNLLQYLIPFNDGVWGEYEIGGDARAIVTSGLAGWGFPIKTAGRAEYLIIDVLPRG